MTTVTIHDDSLQRVETYLTRSGLFPANPRVLPLTGDASDRKYFRVMQPDTPSVVLAVHQGAIEFATLPFVNVARLLERMPVPIPAILGHDDDLGILAQEDLGDVTLQAHLGAGTSADHAALYRQAVGLIAQLQRHGAAHQSEEFLPYRVAFDVEKLTWELEYFARHYLESYRGLSLSDAHREALRDEWSPIVEELAAEPRVLCHRDYHSRNLMLHGGRLYLIDFQDARMGPNTYDLVSLLRDSYMDMSEQLVTDLIAYFLALRDDDTDAQAFRLRFDLMAIQRNLKALGTFGYQTAVRSNPVYIQYMPRTLTYVRQNLERYPRFGRLRELLDPALEERRASWRS
jgi:aminoglycoside/choline kinase family phosphotransferase